jgi:peptide/nickel transport system substrate-binding protein
LRIGAVIVAIITLLGGALTYRALASSSSSTNTGGLGASCMPSSTNPIVVDQAEVPDTLDVQAAYTTPGWGAVQQVYQTLLMYNQSSITNFTGILAKNWSHTSDGLHWTFNLWTAEHFSNGDPINAYVLWYSFYRAIILASGMSFLPEENFYVPGVTFYSNINTINTANATLLAELAEFNTVTNVTTPPSNLLTAMMASGQSFQVLNNLSIQLNLGYGYLDYAAAFGGIGTVAYSDIPQQVAAPPFAAVDPLVISAHGGVQHAVPSSWMSNNMLGSGPYNLTSWNYAVGITYTPNKNYWATSIAAQEPWNNNIQPAKSSISVEFQSDPTVNVKNLESGAVSMASFNYIGTSVISPLKSDTCLSVQQQPIVSAATEGDYWVYLDQAPAYSNEPANPFTNLSLREAVIHAINYQNIVGIFGGLASQWVGPVPPGYPYYNPQNLPPYAFNLTLAKQEVANSPCASGCSGINFDYINAGDWVTVADEIYSDLKQIGITLNLVPVTYNDLVTLQIFNPTTLQCLSDMKTAFGGPFYIGMDYYTADYPSPDDATQLDFLSYGSYNYCSANFNDWQQPYWNATLDQWVLNGAATSDPTLETQYYSEMTQYMYANYTNAWLVTPDVFAIYNVNLHGVVLNPMGSVFPFGMQYNTQYVAATQP